MRTLILTIIAFAAASFAAVSATIHSSDSSANNQQTFRRQTVGLVLSGGGARGIAHVGVIQALEDNDISIDYVTGTSMGAIVGGFYSCGYSPAEMMRLFTSQDFLDWSTGVIAPENIYNFFQPAPTAKWLQIDASLQHGFKLQNDVLPGSLISPLPMNIEFMRLFSPYAEECRGNFNNLFVPFRCVASNVYAKHKVVFSKGSLSDAIRASMSFPMVFKPLEIDGTLLFDGGIYDNFPVDVMREDFHPDIMIGINVSEPDGKPIQNDLYSQLEDMIIQNNDYSLPAKEGIKIQVPVQEYAVLDFPAAKAIYDIGYRTGMEMVDSIKKRVHARTPAAVVAERRREFAARLPEVRFDSVHVEGATPAQSKAIKTLFTRGKRGPFTLEEATQSYYQAISTGKLVDLVPRAIFTNTDSTTLLLRANVRNRWSLGVGGWITSSVHSMFYLSAGFRSLTLRELDLSLSGWIGQSYFAGALRGRIMLPSVRPTSLEFEGVASRSKYYDNELLFYQSSTPTFITDDELFARITYSIASGRHGRFNISAAYGTMRDAYYASNDVDFATTSRDISRYHTAVVSAKYEYYTLNNHLYPTEGREFKVALRGIHESSIFLPEGRELADMTYRKHPLARAEASWRQFFPLHDHFHLGAQAQTVVTFGPLYQNYTATLVHAPSFEPTPSTSNYFMACLRAPSFVAIGLTPIWIPMSRMQLRGDLHAFLPLRNVVEGPGNSAHYSGWMRHPEFVAELAAIYSFPFAELSLYGNYITTPGHRWHFGVNFGLLFQAPRLLR